MTRKIVAAFALAILAACGTPAHLAQAIDACARGASHLEIVESGHVTRVLGLRRTRNGLHEGFLFRAGAATLTVEDNADITGPIPLHAGDLVTLQGQYECNDGVIHWTHHDPSLRHPAGYLDVNGKLYQ